ncbi:MAG: hypothetical protein KDM64_19215, partial [Verrucomicrobiae bacterium]|nr:hypothetical protein [Verrucomicrobiae bacterium]
MNPFRDHSTPIILAIFFASAPWGRSDETASREFFAREVYPILKEHCYRCHGEEEKLKGDFRITSREGLLHGGGLGPALDEAEPKASLLLESVAYTNDDLQMPPKNRLSEDQVAVLTRWVTD